MPYFIAQAAAAATFMLVCSAQGAVTYKVLHYFFDKPAAGPLGTLIADPAGNLYGTTTLGADQCGSAPCGTVFKLTRKSGGEWNYSTIHHFKSTGAYYPAGDLIFDASGNLYGVTLFGGTMDLGTVFELLPSGGKWREKILYSFGTHSNDLTQPGARLLFGPKGNLFGTSQGGGTDSQGGVFELKHVGNLWKETVIYNFTGATDGGFPGNNLVRDPAGRLYGITQSGGDLNCDFGVGCGTVFKLTPSSNGTWKESVLYNFTDGTDGYFPGEGLIFDAVGNLYGTTVLGGFDNDCGGFGCGTIFKLTPSMGTWTFSILHTFDNTDGAEPSGVLIFDSSGALYGTCEYGDQGYGNVFKLSPSGNSWTLDVLHSFVKKGDGGNPQAALIFDQQGVLYGTASTAGVHNSGGVFSITP